jgi:uncharacterized protein (DUF58 family)
VNERRTLRPVPGAPTSGAPGALPAIPAEVLRRLELTVTRRLDGILQGDYLGLVPGRGTESGEARAYEPGDDVRRIDWNVTARTTVPHVRQTIADRELEAWLVADMSASLAFGTARCEKRDLVLAAATAVSVLTARLGNRLGAVRIEPYGRLAVVPARTGRHHARAILHGLASEGRRDGGGATDLIGALGAARRSARRRGLVVVLSDFVAPGAWERPLRSLTARHDVLAIEVVDPRDLELPAVGLLQLVDPETGRRVEVQTGSKKIRAGYAAAAAAQRADIAQRIRASGADHLVLRTDRDWVLDLVRFVALRRHRARYATAATLSPGSTR